MSNIKVHLEWHWCLTIPGSCGNNLLLLFLLWRWMNDTHTLQLYLGVGLSKFSSDIQVTFYLKLMSFWHWPSLDSEKVTATISADNTRYPAKLPMEMRPGTHLSPPHICTRANVECANRQSPMTMTKKTKRKTQGQSTPGCDEAFLTRHQNVVRSKLVGSQSLKLWQKNEGERFSNWASGWWGITQEYKNTLYLAQPM